MESERSMLEGVCDCGGVKWSYTPVVESVTACNCNMCRRYGALWAYDFIDAGITVTGETREYARNGKVLDFHFCVTCGCISHYVVRKSDSEGRRKAAVNLRLITNPERIQHLPIDHFDGLDSWDDLPRDGRCVKDLWF